MRSYQGMIRNRNVCEPTFHQNGMRAIILIAFVLSACQASAEGFTVRTPDAVRVAEPYSLDWTFTADEESVVMIRYAREGEYGAPVETVVIPSGTHTRSVRAFSIGDEQMSSGRYALGLDSFRAPGTYTITFVHTPCSALAGPCESIAAPSEITILEARGDERLTVKSITIDVFE